MKEIILIDETPDNYKIINKVVNQLRYLIEEGASFTRYEKVNEELLRKFKETDSPKIYFLYVDKNQKFIKIANYIRKCDWNSRIILLVKEKYLLDDSYDKLYKIFNTIHINRYFAKMIRRDLCLILREEQLMKRFHYKNRNEDINILYRNILYVYRDTVDRKAVIVTQNNSYAINVSMNKLKEELSRGFVQCHRACLVNKNRIEKLDWQNKNIVLDNGVTVNYLSSKYKDDLEF